MDECDFCQQEWGTQPNEESVFLQYNQNTTSLICTMRITKNKNPCCEVETKTMLCLISSPTFFTNNLSNSSGTTIFMSDVCVGVEMG